MTTGLLPSDVFLTSGNALIIGLSLVATTLSALIAYQAYRGYRRNGSRPMLFLAIGFMFITTIPFFVDLVFYPIFGRMYSAQITSIVLPVVKYGIQILGLSFVLYSLYGRRSDTASVTTE
jgi:hypothetical protein